MTGERSIAENHGQFLVIRVDGKWYDAAIASDAKLRLQVGLVPETWIVRDEENLRPAVVSGTPTGCATNVSTLSKTDRQ